MIMLAFSTLAFSFLAAALARAPIRPPSSSGDSCTFSYVQDLASKKHSCSTITVKNLAVPAGTTLDLTGLSNQNVIFQGTTTFGYASWDGPLIQIAGENVVVTGAPGHEINGQGQHWWDGKGKAGGPKKPKGIVVTLTNGAVNGLVLKSMPLNGELPSACCRC